MAIRTRTNPKTNKIEYKARYLWKDSSGKRKDSETGWFSTPNEALNEAIRLKKAKTEKAKMELELGKDKTVNALMDEWLKELEDIAYRDTMENTTSDVSLFRKARLLKNDYSPEDIKNTKIRDVDVNTYRKWLNYINKTKISGASTRDFKQVLRKFNKYTADKGYYLENALDLDIDMALERVSVKPKKAGKRQRYCPTISDINKILDVYLADMGVEKFKNMYWYSLFMTLFFSGMRVEELVGLQWKSVYFNVSRPYIDIQNAISELEVHKNAMSRVKAGVYHTKNTRSNREIPIFEYYYDVLESYRTKYMIEFSLDKKDIQENFVYPNITAKNKEERLDYQKHKNILRELDRVCKIAGVEKTDCQMFRHACATWLVMDKEHGGMGYTEAQAKDYFGHTSDDMLRDVYALLDKRQRANRTSETFKLLSKENAVNKEKTALSEDIVVSSKVASPELNKKDKDEAIYSRVYSEVMECIRNKKKYIVNLKDLSAFNDVIEDIEIDHAEWLKDLNIGFIETGLEATDYRNFEKEMKDIGITLDEAKENKK